MMDNIREKLVELLKVPIYPHLDADPAEVMADYLLDNGVTVQEWIPVTERKPDLELVEAKADDFDLYACLATIKNDRARNGTYVGKAWYDGEGFMDSDCVDITYEVTHWMPLPTLPKGE